MSGYVLMRFYNANGFLRESTRTPRVRDPAEAIAIAVFSGEAKRSPLLEKERATVKTPTAFRTRFVSKQ